MAESDLSLLMLSGETLHGLFSVNLPVPWSMSMLTGLRSRNSTPCFARAVATFSTSVNLVETPGLPSSTPHPASPKSTLFVTSLVFISSVPLPGTSVSANVANGSLKSFLMSLGGLRSGCLKASTGHSARMQVPHSTHFTWSTKATSSTVIAWTGQ